SALAELLATTRLVQTDLLAFDFAGIAGDEASLRQCRLERRIIVDQRAGNAMAHGAGLSVHTAAVDVDVKVEGLQMAGQFQRLANDHATRFAREVLVHGLAVDDDLARAFFQEHTGHRSLAAAGSVIPVTDHARLLRFPAAWAAERCGDVPVPHTPSAS